MVAKIDGKAREREKYRSVSWKRKVAQKENLTKGNQEFIWIQWFIFFRLLPCTFPGQTVQRHCLLLHLLLLCCFFFNVKILLKSHSHYFTKIAHAITHVASLLNALRMLMDK